MSSKLPSRAMHVFVWLTAAVLVGCSRAPAADEAPTTELLRCTPQTVSRLYFGLDTPDGPVAEAAWQGFVDGEVTRRLPEGFTVLAARGQWRGSDGRVLREDSRVLEVIAPDSPQHRQVLADIAVRYKQRFRQQSVLITQSAARSCA